MVTEIVNQTNSFQQAFRELQDREPTTHASWINRLRENAMARFEEVGFPTIKDEEWKYTNVAPIIKKDFTVPSAAEITDGAPADDLASWFL